MLRPPDFDAKPLYHDGTGVGWVGYGMFFDWPSACFQIFVWHEGEWSQWTDEALIEYMLHLYDGLGREGADYEGYEAAIDEMRRREIGGFE